MIKLAYHVGSARSWADLFMASAVLLTSAAGQVATVSKATGKQVTRILSQHIRSTAVTADGRLFCLSYFDDGRGAGDASRSLRIHVSNDAGKTWKIATQMRTLGPLRGSIATDVDGETLHTVFEARAGRGHSSIYYAAWNSRTKLWLAADKVLAKSTGANSQFFMPSIDVARDKSLVVSFYTHRQGPWAGMMRIGRGGNWTAAARVNKDVYGVRIDHQIHGHDVWFAYRTNTGGYGIRARRYDLVKKAWGSEGELQVSGRNGKKLGTANNSSCVAVDRSGKVWVLWSSGASSSGKGAIWLSGKAPAASQFNEHYKVSDDAGILGGNRTYDHFSLAVDSSGRVFVYYALLSEKLTNLWMRFPLATRLSPKLAQVRGKPDDMLRINGLRLTALRAPGYVLLEDRAGKSLRIFVRGAGLSVPHVRGCSGTGAAAPLLTTKSAPALGATIRFDFAQLGANAAGIFMLGIDKRKFGPFSLPLPLDALGFSGCLLAQAPLANAAFAGNAQGTASIPLQYPALKALTGVPLYWQGFVIAAKANPGGGLLSNGVATIAQ